ncbi:MAG: adenylate/guanylate cyclase domain-containing protein, partial [Desulfobacteraceae bacterium]|nr:adenylate/guanylate cyclase domain-containing protein [Desulfobacteraceae bacterium]
FFILGFVFLCTIASWIFRNRSYSQLLKISRDKASIKDLDASETHHIQREALKLPMVLSLRVFFIWIMAGFMWGFLEPITRSTLYSLSPPDTVDCVRRFLGITIMGGSIISFIIYFIVENTWREYIPKFFPEGKVTHVKHVFRINVQKRILIVLLGMTFIPIPIIGAAIISKVDTLKLADTLAVDELMASLAWELCFIAMDSVFLSILLAYFLSKSISIPLLKIKKTIKKIENNELDTQVEIVSNDEIGEVAEGINLMIKSLKEGQTAKESFGRYVCKEIRDEILAGNTSLDGEMTRATLLFSDLRNFTSLVEKNHPKDVVKIMNQYFDEMTIAVKDNKGLILQYVGDEIEAAFGVPIKYDDHPDMAVKAALEMRKRLKNLNVRLKEQGFEPIAHGIGIHSGAVLAGNIGSEARMSYALVGDTVNSASRIEGLTKEFSCDIILTATTRSLLTENYKTEQLAPVKVKGKDDELIVYKLL